MQDVSPISRYIVISIPMARFFIVYMFFMTSSGKDEFLANVWKMEQRVFWHNTEGLLLKLKPMFSK